MSLPRRSFLQLAALTASAVSTAACSSNFRIAGSKSASLSSIGMLAADERAVLDRLCYGIGLVESQRVAEIGLASWIEEQLSQENVTELDLRWRMRNLDVLAKNADEIEDAHKRGEVIEQLRRGTLLRQLYSRRQIYEMMVEFWGDHFNISVEKGPGWALKIVDDREVIRVHALGSFHDLLSASAHSPAMLVYLDNQANDKHAPNENYARELLELHTLGIDGGYSQADVAALARCLTGWTVKKNFWRGDFEFDEERHDSGLKELLGLRIEAAGEAEVEQVLMHLARDGSTGRQLAIKMLRRFVCDDPERRVPEWVRRLEQVFLLTRGDITAMLRKLLLDGIVRDPTLLGKKVKRPVDYVVSALRITDAEADGGIGVQRFLNRMGQPTFAWPTPDGPPDIAQAWSSNLAPRWEFSLRLMSGLIEGSQPGDFEGGWLEAGGNPEEILTAASEYILGVTLRKDVSDELITAVRGADGLSRSEKVRAVVAGLLAAPGFQYR